MVDRSEGKTDRIFTRFIFKPPTCPQSVETKVFCMISPLLTARCSLFTRAASTSSALFSHHPGWRRPCHDLSPFHLSIKSCIQTSDPWRALFLLRNQLRSTVKPNDLSFSLLVKACASDPCHAKLEALEIQTLLIKLGFDRFVYVSTALLCFWAELGCVSHACKLFDEMPSRDVVSWNALIYGYSRNGCHFNALGLFVQMLEEGFRPSQTTLVGLVPSCARTELALQGKSLHAFGMKAGLDLDSKLKNALTSMYAKCADLESAELLFGEMVERDVVSWNAMISAYGQNFFFDEAMVVFKRMLRERAATNAVTLMSLLPADAHPDSTHCYAIKTGLTADAAVITSLVCAYARAGNTESAESLYESSHQKILISLTAIILSHAEKGNSYNAIECFANMLGSGIKPDAVAMVSILQVVTEPAHINIGKVLHCFGSKSGLCSNSLVVNGMMSMYAKCDDTEAGLLLFSGLHEKTLISWNTAISSCVRAGRPDDAIELFCRMKIVGQHRPDAITVATLLCGCSQLGYLHYGKKLHSYALRNILEVAEFVGTALIDMYAKCGSMGSAERVFGSINRRCLVSWNTMINAYSLYGLERKALGCYTEMLQNGLRPDRITFLGVLSACTHAGLTQEGWEYFRIMREEFGVEPGVQHCTSMVYLLGRAGLFSEAFVFIKSMEIEPDATVWGALLGACCIHQELRLGECVAKKLFFLDYYSGGFYIMMSNLYADKERWDDVGRVREIMRDTGGDDCSGFSLIELTSMENINDNSGFCNFYSCSASCKTVSTFG